MIRNTRTHLRQRRFMSGWHELTPQRFAIRGTVDNYALAGTLSAER
jgi:hypothetical protein